MAANLNKVLLIGNLTRDPELRYLPSGQAVATFTVAVNRNFTSQSGEKKEEASFIRIVVWARRAEVCNEYLKKGSPVFVEGRLQTRSWESSDGTKRSTTEVVAQNVQFLSRGTRQTTPEPAMEDDAAFLEGAEAGSVDRGPNNFSEKDLQPDDEIPF
ncbi:MAG: single-stranded DNA-binding protein [Candidatus Omnitrophica bacterium]|nr:single-stranded DNA-binding protein [Candidatus Omnitrophota bacterium]